MFVEEFDELCKVGKRPCQPVDLVNDDDIDLAGPDLVQKGLQGRAVQRGAGEPTVVEPFGGALPAFVGLALDISVAGFSLGIERVESEIEIVLGRFARVDRAALRFWRVRLHAPPSGCSTERGNRERGTDKPDLTSRDRAGGFFIKLGSRVAPDDGRAGCRRSIPEPWRWR